jgi:hypothetical protein
MTFAGQLTPSDIPVKMDYAAANEYGTGEMSSKGSVENAVPHLRPSRVLATAACAAPRGNLLLSARRAGMFEDLRS